ncbi:helix-turn-helix transcriptional regulator [Saccharothrix longispora]|uniref:helix-turn-helix domain-containing protein n=1 Tax=Saccharothrix longispora TaxID=33920 RepID=UPI0028FD5F79|nr:helix-turn-helix transcriptional regulator [Saccharothrix longispora]MDU0288279.1 helix-turn-helix transcriptional regulator [Saccharothrix longispora]
MAAPQHSPGSEQVLCQEKFADALRTAIARRDLTLDRIRARLAARGVEISIATLSYWQQGRSRPERPNSLRALRELEDILDLPPDTLFEFLEPPRPRGRRTTGGRLSVETLYGSDSPIRAVLGDLVEPNPDVAVLATTETCFVDARRSLRRVSTTQVLRGTGEGCDRFVTVHGVDEGDVMPSHVVVRGGRLGALKTDGTSGYASAEIEFGRVLDRNETTVVEYEWVMGESPVPSRGHERRIRDSTDNYLLRVCFDRVALPARCYAHHRPRVTTPVQQRRRVPVDPVGQAHLYLSKCDPGVYGISWEWE